MLQSVLPCLPRMHVPSLRLVRLTCRTLRSAWEANTNAHVVLAGACNVCRPARSSAFWQLRRCSLSGQALLRGLHADRLPCDAARGSFCSDTSVTAHGMLQAPPPRHAARAASPGPARRAAGSSAPGPTCPGGAAARARRAGTSARRPEAGMWGAEEGEDGTMHG